MTPMVFLPIIILENTGYFTKGEIYDVLYEDGDNIYLEDDEGRYCFFSKKEDRDLWRHASDKEINERDFSSVITFNKYQNFARQTAIYPHQAEISGLVYTTLGLNGESGEVAEKVKKLIRDNNGVISIDFADNLEKELGDVLWYLSNICDELGLSLEDVARQNLVKLFSREKRGKLHGDGDNR